jgi:hypothetical protein
MMFLPGHSPKSNGARFLWTKTFETMGQNIFCLKFFISGLLNRDERLTNILAFFAYEKKEV